MSDIAPQRHASDIIPECSVCIDKFNKSTCSRVICIGCSINICQKCCKRYIMESGDFAKCMSCKEPWSISFLFNNFSSTWINNEYKNHKENVINDRHNATVHQYQAHIISKKRELEYKKEISSLIIQIHKIREQMSILDVWANNEFRFYEGHTNEQPEPRHILELRRSEEDIRRIEEIALRHKENQIKQRGHCPKTDCKGTIGENWACILCLTKICGKCRIEEAEEHICRDEDIKTTELINSDSKNCPNCSVRIFRSQGCPSMWCIICKSFFNWNTLEIQTNGFQHNPEYIRYLNERPKQPIIKDNKKKCEEITYTNFVNIFDKIQIWKNGRHIDEIKKICILQDYIHDFQETYRLTQQMYDEINTFRTNFISRIDYLNRNLGIRFLENRITNECKKKILQQKNKETEKLRDTHNIREILCDQLNVIIFNFIKKIENLNEFEQIDDINKELQESIKDIEFLEDFCNKSMTDIGHHYNSVKPDLYSR